MFNQDFVSTFDNFSFKYAHSLFEKEHNSVFSPFEIYLSLEYLSNFLSEEKCHEFQKLILNDDSSHVVQDWRQFFKEIATDQSKYGSKSSVKLLIGDETNREKLEALQQLYPLLNVEKTDFKTEDAKQKLDKWISEQSDDSIRTILDPNQLKKINDLLVVTFSNLQIKWDIPFLKKSTKLMPFKLSSGNVIQVDTMEVVSEFKISTVNQYDAKIIFLEIDKDHVMIIALPKKLEEFEKMKKEMLSTDYTTFFENIISSKFESSNIRLRMPKMNLDCEESFKNDFKHLGVEKIIAQDKNIVNLSSKRPLKVDDIYQKLSFKIDENGINCQGEETQEIKSETKEDVRQEAIEEFLIDSPFMFAIINFDNSLTRLIGQIVNPNC